MLYSATDFLMALLCKQAGKVYLPCLRTKKYIMREVVDAEPLDGDV